MNPSAQQALAHYLEGLLREPNDSGPNPEASPPDAVAQRLAEPVLQETPLLEADRLRQLQALLDSHRLPVAPQAEPKAPPEPITTPVVARPVVAPVAAPQAVQEQGLLQWCANGRPAWAQKRFEVLLFKVGGLTLAAPLIALGQIRPISDGLTPIFGQANWLMGLQPEAGGNVRVVNTALLVMPERYDPSFLQRAKYIITLADMDWGLAVEAVGQPMSLEPDAVTWRSERGKRRWLAGTVTSAMCALLDIPRLGQQLDSSDRRRTT